MQKTEQGTSLEEKARAKIAKYLPDAVETAIQSYRRFYSEEKAIEDGDAKAFSAHHSACKAAIAHIELLLKLAAWAHLPRDTQDDTLGTLMAHAQAELDKYRREEPDE